MPYINISVEEALEDVSADDLKRELLRRTGKSQDHDTNGLEPWTPSGLADDLRSAFYRRDASRFEALLIVLQPHQCTPEIAE